ncbi:MAG TPA: DMT family transporter [Nannocystaceae bacterium]|nr:DMT family transporter [Nannocystaceae bacterium]
MILGIAGELAALGTALCWAFTSIWFTGASRRVGALPVNFLRMPIAFAWLCIYGLVVRGHALPTDADAHVWGWLAASALAGFAFGDLCLFRALVLIGPRLASLVMASAPLFTALLGWLALGEVLEPTDVLGMLLTTGGIAWAIAGRLPQGAVTLEPQVLRRGIVLALCGAVGQAAGLVLAKHGMGAHYDPFAATQIRVLIGAVSFTAMCITMRGWPGVVAAIRDRKTLGLVVLGATFGPFLGVGLSLTAAQLTAAGIAASLMALQPLLIIPLAIWIEKERVGPRAIFAAALAVAGVILLVS